MKIVAFVVSATLLFASCKEKSETVVEEVPETEVTSEETLPEPTKPEETEIWEPVPVKVDPIGKNGVPGDAMVLFDGKNFDQWISSRDSTEVKWTLNADGSMTVKDKTGDIQTKQNFGSVQLHMEWRSNPENQQTNQNRSNSGVFFQNRYEVQILDNNDNPTYVNGMVGSIYKQSIPLAMAAKPTGEWNTYDIIFHAPEFDAEGNKKKSRNTYRVIEWRAHSGSF